MLSAFWSKFWGWMCAVGVVIVAFGSAYLAGMRKGEDKQQAKVDEAKQEAYEAKQVQEIVEARHEIDVKVQALPEVPAQRIGDADPSTAAGMLRQITRD